FTSGILKNEQGRFRFIPLPVEAQFSTIQGIAVEDFDQDGQPDILIGGNLFQAEIETTRADASIGLLLKGNKSPEMVSPVSVTKSGVFLPNDIKDVKAIRVQGKTGFLASANNAALVYFKNMK
ncbi:MAG TPA: VCBS repeat-containing protein, partial [Saprospiraceae bacterium]|nr:VCBS repeat-containing protein [Saprospiraceae bacterium]